MTILEFCKNRKVQASTVSMYIRRNSELFEGHITKNGQQTEIDDAAFDILDKKYPIPPEVIPSPNAEVLKELDAAKSYIIHLQQQVIENNEALALAERNKFLLEEAKSSCEDLQEKNGNLLEEIGSLKAQLAAAEEKASRAEQEASKAAEEAEKLRSRSLWQRIFNT